MTKDLTFNNSLTPYEDLLAYLDSELAIRTGPTYVVSTEAFKRGTLAVVYKGHSRDQAVSKTNFWDQRANTYMTVEVPRKPSGALEVAVWRFDFLISMLEGISERNAN